ncbi:MAG TPA: hypothetical protein VK037_03540 [Pseudogracilibacillus sp.]|nr:hypothetical protein [Pseudogracilibacillus sp.]
MNKKLFLLQLVNQLEEDKVDSLIDVVKGMVYPANEQSVTFQNSTPLQYTMVENKQGEKIVQQNINDIFL